MFRAKVANHSSSGTDSTDSPIVISSLVYNAPVSPTLTFRKQHEKTYHTIKQDLKKVVSPCQKVSSDNMKVISKKHPRRKVVSDEYSGVSFEHTLYTPPVSQEFSLSPNRTKISPSELILLREKHATRTRQVELHASAVSLPSGEHSNNAQRRKPFRPVLPH
mmetsp:Transcript_16798/g.25250  ORF Transcript_16798/g.25250 Transcript_16798/m.25250 type:complete len:162 (+) Transcript_16798:132-617(+)